MIEKLYEVTCDYCGFAINQYAGNKPSKKELENDGFIVYKGLVFCSKQCFNDWKAEQKNETNLKTN